MLSFIKQLVVTIQICYFHLAAKKKFPVPTHKNLQPLLHRTIRESVAVQRNGPTLNANFTKFLIKAQISR